MSAFFCLGEPPSTLISFLSVCFLSCLFSTAQKKMKKEEEEEEEVVGTTRKIVVHILTQEFLLRMMYLSSVVFGVLNKRAGTRVFRRPWNLGDGPCARVWERQNLFYSSDNCLLFYRDGDCSSHPTRSESGA